MPDCLLLNAPAERPDTSRSRRPDMPQSVNSTDWRRSEIRHRARRTMRIQTRRRSRYRLVQVQRLDCETTPASTHRRPPDLRLPADRELPEENEVRERCVGPELVQRGREEET